MSWKSENLDDDDDVFVTSATSALCLHVDPDCQMLRRAHSIHQRKAGQYHDGTTCCKVCTGRAKDSSETYSREYYQALKAAAKSDD